MHAQYVHMPTYIHTYIHACMHRPIYIHACMPTYILVLLYYRIATGQAKVKEIQGLEKVREF